jgi:3-oxoacyl-[acyl-carrier-protein] synthase III
VARSQQFSNVVVSGLAHVDAPHIVTSDEIESQLADTLQRLGMPTGTLAGLAGIKERRFWDEGTRPSDAAAMAGAKLLADAGVDRRDVGALINTSVDRDWLEPSTACIVHHKLGLAPDALNFDVGNACLGFINGMALTAAMIERGDIDHAIVVDGESARYVVESTIARLADPSCDRDLFRASFATLTLGSGAAAMLLSRRDLADDGHPFHGVVSRAATEHHELCQGQPDDMRTDAAGLLTAGLALGRDTWRHAADVFDWSADAIDAAFIHQVSRAHTRSVIGALGLREDRIPLLYPHHGNIGPAGLVITWSKEVDAGRLTPGDRLALLGIGSGLNCAMADVRW